jgi:aminoglycoside phosphotransferase family enzyme/predicted kinase
VNAADPRTSLDTAEARATFVAALRSAAPYAARHRVDEPVRCIETHVSWVFLTGPFAYKVKKPVKLSFLDYSTMERRAALCREELRLNQRQAPELYVAVVPISGSVARPVVGGIESEAFEHALQMVQFDPTLELGHELNAGRVEPAQLCSLGATIARMHRNATPATVADDFGTPERVHRITLANFDEIATCLPARTNSLQELRSRVDALFEHCQSLMRERRARACVRECHGDLHCGNVVQWNNRLVPFDALEFDPALRFIDVASDVAFLSMDLGAHGRPDLRRTLLDAWLAESGDYEAVRLLPYFEAYRALVRAKVLALRTAQVAATRSSQSAVLRSATVQGEPANDDPHYLEWALQQARRGPPTLLLLAGLSGSGKTTLARRLAPALAALHLRSDVERKRLAGLAPLEASGSAPDAGLYTQDFNRQTYDRLAACARACLAGGESVIVDAANLRQHERARFIEAARAEGAHVVLVVCTAPIDVLKARVASRLEHERDASEATVELLDRQPAYWEPLTPAERELALTIDTTDATAIDRLVSSLRAGSGDACPRP